MSDMTANTQPTPQKSTSSLYDETKRTKRRNQSEVRFKAYGVAAIAVGLFFLIALLVAIFSNGIPAFKQTFITIPVELTETALDKTGNRDVAEMSKVSTFGYKPVVTNALVTALKDAGIAIPFKKEKDVEKLLSSSVAAQVRDTVLADPSLVGTSVEFRLLASSRVDGYFKGRVTRDALIRDKNLDAEHLDIADAMAKAGLMATTFNADFIFGSDASESRPEQAGIGVSMMGSLFMMIVVLLLSLPIGVATSIYLEEFAPQNRFTDLEPCGRAFDRLRYSWSGRVHPVCAPAAIRAFGRWFGVDADDPANDHHFDPRLIESCAALDPRCRFGGWGLENAIGVPPCAALGDAGNLDRDHHRSGTGFGRNRTFAVDRDGGLYRLQHARRDRLRLS